MVNTPPRLAGTFHNNPPGNIPRWVLIVGVHSADNTQVTFEVVDDDEKRYLIKVWSDIMKMLLNKYALAQGFRDNEDFCGTTRMYLSEHRTKHHNWWTWEYRREL